MKSASAELQDGTEEEEILVGDDIAEIRCKLGQNLTNKPGALACYHGDSGSAGTPVFNFLIFPTEFVSFAPDVHMSLN